jgi:hypothetical protein
MDSLTIFLTTFRWSKRRIRKKVPTKGKVVHNSVSPEIEPGGIVFPSQNNNIIYICLAYCKPCGNWKFLAVRWVGFDDPLRVSC